MHLDDMNGDSRSVLLAATQRDMLTFDPDNPPDTVRGDELFGVLLDAWREARIGRLAPERQDLQPEKMPRVLSRVFILDVVPDDFRFRLVGEEINRRYGHKLKGHSISGLLDGTVLEDTLKEHRACAMQLKAVLTCRHTYAVDPEDRLTYDRLLLPLSIDAGVARHIVGAMRFHRAG